MRYLFIIALLLQLQATCQPYITAHVYWNFPETNNNRKLIKTIQYNNHFQPVSEMEYIYKYNAEDISDTIVTHFSYNEQGLLEKKWNSTVMQLYYYDNTGKIIRDNLYGPSWDNEYVPADSSAATYHYYEGYYVINRIYNDSLSKTYSVGASSRIDTFVQIDQQKQKHVSIINTDSDEPCTHGPITYTQKVYSKTTNLPDGRISSIIYYYEDEKDPMKIEEYTYDK